MKKNQFFFVIVFWLFSCNADNEIKKESNQIKKEYYTNGKLKSEIEYKGSLKHGKVKIYYDNGSLEKEYSYDKDTLNGPFKSYEVDGKLQSKGFYWRGEAIGPIFHYNKGILQLYNEKDFSGTYYYVKKYLLDGKLIKEEGVCLSPNAIGPDTISKNKTYELLFFTLSQIAI